MKSCEEYKTVGTDLKKKIFANTEIIYYLCT